MRDLMMRIILVVAMLGLVAGATAPARAGTILKYTDLSAFQATTPGALNWDLEGLDNGFYTNLTGPGSIQFGALGITQPTTFENLFSPQWVTGKAGHSNVPGSIDKDIHFSNAVNAFGFGVIWTNDFTVKDVTLKLYDPMDQLIGSVGLVASDTGVQSEMANRFTYNSGFLGFTSDTGVSRITILQQPGATYYDNFRWVEAVSPVPEPSSLISGGLACLMMLGYGWCHRKARKNDT